MGRGDWLPPFLMARVEPADHVSGRYDRGGRSRPSTRLAVLLGRVFVDTDQEIERRRRDDRRDLRRRRRAAPSCARARGDRGTAKEAASWPSAAEQSPPGALERLRKRASSSISTPRSIACSSGSVRRSDAGCGSRCARRAARLSELLEAQQPLHRAGRRSMRPFAGRSGRTDRPAAGRRKHFLIRASARKIGVGWSEWRPSEESLRVRRLTGSRACRATAALGRACPSRWRSGATRSSSGTTGWTIGARIGALLAVERVAVVSVAPVARRYARCWSGAWRRPVRRTGASPCPTAMPPDLRQAERPVRALPRLRARSTRYVALGGGVVGDLRGVPAPGPCAGFRSSRCRRPCSR